MNDNAVTLKTYDDNVQIYLETTRSTVIGDNKDWLDRITALLPAHSSILELGSASGRDATYLEHAGHEVLCSDATQRFVEHLKTAGHNTQLINILEDDPSGSYDIILANMVFLHFNLQELEAVLLKVHSKCKKGGLLAFSVREGVGEEWSNSKLAAPRFYKYWTIDKLQDVLEHNHYEVIDIRKGDSTNLDKIYVIAQAKT